MILFQGGKLGYEYIVTIKISMQHSNTLLHCPSFINIVAEVPEKRCLFFCIFFNFTQGGGSMGITLNRIHTVKSHRRYGHLHEISHSVKGYRG